MARYKADVSHAIIVVI